MTHVEIGALIAAVQALWPTVPYRIDTGAATVKAWHLVLADIDGDEALAHVVTLSRSGAEFPPTPGAIADAVLTERARTHGLAPPDPDQAWVEVMQAVAQRGLAAGPPEWSHPAVAAAAKAMTWRDLCTSDNPAALRAHFLQMYKPAAARAIEATRPIGALPRYTPELE